MWHSRERRRIDKGFLVRKPERKRPVGRLDIGGRIILKLILEK
jgi:hypothetical protein